MPARRLHVAARVLRVVGKCGRSIERRAHAVVTPKQAARVPRVHRVLLRQHLHRRGVEVHERGRVVELGKRVQQRAQVLEDHLHHHRSVERRERPEELADYVFRLEQAFFGRDGLVGVVA